MKLTKAQRRIAAMLHDGGRFEAHFDVWGPKNNGGVTWVLDGVETVPYRTANALISRAIIAPAATYHPYSGHSITPHTLTDAGRAALERSP